MRGHDQEESSAFNIPGLGCFGKDCGLTALENTSDGVFRAGSGGVVSVCATGDTKVEVVSFDRSALALVTPGVGRAAYYPVLPISPRPICAVLMDLDGTTVRSEAFWISVIEATVKSLLDNPRFGFEDADIPFVSGHSVSEHLNYCINKYCPGASLKDATAFYFEHTEREMDLVAKGERRGAFTPNEGVFDFLRFLKGRGIRIGLVTSGLLKKAWPEILSAFDVLGLGPPEDFYDSIVTAGVRPGRGESGTLGELEAKPHPWLYAESGIVGLGIPAEDSDTVIGIEDSGAGVCSVRLAGYRTVGLGGGNIRQSGTMAFVSDFCETFEDVGRLILEAD